MAATLQNAKISCRGGLDLRSTSQELLSTPGVAQVLQNFECVTSGGYRRINGFTTFGVNPVPGTGKIKGIYIFNKSILVARGNDIYHSFDASTWVQINKNVTAANLATITASTDILPMSEEVEDVRFSHYSDGTVLEEQFVTMVNGVDEVMLFTVTGDDHNNATYTFKFLDNALTGAPVGCKYTFVFKDQVYLSGRADTPSNVYVSALFNPEDYTGTSSLEINVGDHVRGMYPFRTDMIVFCKDSIHKLTGVAEANASLQPITENIGCLANDSIQEIGGDLVFLADDGIRTLAATQRIGDVELSSVSSQIYPLLKEVLMDKDSYKIVSTTLREKSQYRLYFSRIGDVLEINQKGVIGTLTLGQGGLGWNWSSTKGIDCRHLTAGFTQGRFVSLMSSREDGILYEHDVGDTFNTARIPAIFTTPYFDMGDPSIRKNVHRVKSYIKPEGPADVSLAVLNTGYSNELPHNPNRYHLGELRAPAVYAESSYESSATYGARIVDTKVINTEGSGFTISLNYTSNDVGSSYNIQGFDLDFIVSGKV